MTDLLIPALELVTEDGEPLESNWHRAEINLLIETLQRHWHGRTDFYAGGNMFVYYSTEQVRRRDYRGPDFFVVLNVDGSYPRKAWVVWEEDGRYPDVIVELMSPTTGREDLTTKLGLYEQTFRTPDYFCYDPDEQQLLGWHRNGDHYVELEPNEHGWLWSARLGLWLGQWEGHYLNEDALWLRFYTSQGELLLTEHEGAETERRRAEAERERAERAERRLAELQARLRALGVDPDDTVETG